MILIITFALLINFNNANDISNNPVHGCNSYLMVEVDKPSMRRIILHIMEEQWRFIPGLNLRYSISSFGRVYSYCRGTVIRQSIDKGGYRHVRVSDAFGNKKSLTVHRLVALAFIPNPDNKPQVNHIDTKKCNNCVDNLEWATGAENMKHAALCGVRRDLTGVRYGNKGGSNPKSKSVAMLYESGNIRHIFGSVSEAAVFVSGGSLLNYKVSTAAHIADVCRGGRMRACGHKWKYL